MLEVAADGGSEFIDEVVGATTDGERLRLCLQCGVCGGSCPNGSDMDYTPRALFALIAQGEKERVLGANTMWMCVSCYLCTMRCPKEIPVTDILNTLKRMAIASGHADNDAVALAKTFSRYIYRYGRSFELGIATRYYLARKPGALLTTGPLHVRMLRRGRLSLKPTRIEGLEQLQAILRKACEMGEAG